MQIRNFKYSEEIFVAAISMRIYSLSRLTQYVHGEIFLIENPGQSDIFQVIFILLFHLVNINKYLVYVSS